MAQTIETSETLDGRTLCTVKATWGEFVIDSDKAVEAVGDFLSHYYRSRMGGYALSDGWMQEAVRALSDKCVVAALADMRANATCRV